MMGYYQVYIGFVIPIFWINLECTIHISSIQHCTIVKLDTLIDWCLKVILVMHTPKKEEPDGLNWTTNIPDLSNNEI